MSRKKGNKGDFFHIHVRVSENLHRTLMDKMKDEDQLYSQYVRQLLVKELAMNEHHARWLKDPVRSEYKPKE
jgi:hypothetical protein